MKIYSAIVACLLVASPALATNRGFMPGDACFHSILTQDRLAALTESADATFPFVRPKDEQFAFCGYAGYWSLQLPPNSDSLVTNLNKLYKELRRYSPRELREHVNADGKTIQSETNGFHIFIYNHDFDPLKYNIALRYNETWSEDESSFGPHPRITRLESCVIDRVAFSNDWRDAKAVPPLRAKCPQIPDQEKRMKMGMGNKRIDDPVVATDQVQVIITPVSDFRRYIHRRNGVTFYSVTNAGVKQYTVKKGKWVVSDWSPEPEDG